MENQTPATFARVKTARFSEPLIQKFPLTHQRRAIQTHTSRSAPTPSKVPKEFSYRVEKSRTPVTPRVEVKKRLADWLDDRLEERREWLHDQSKNHLSEKHDAAKAKVDTLSEHFNSCLSLLQDAERPLQSILGHEKLQVPVVRKDSNGKETVQYTSVTLRERAKAFQQFVNDKHGKLTALVDQWTEVQRELIQLTVEMVGLKRLELQKEQVYSELVVAIEAGSKERNKADEQHQEVLSDLGEAEQQARGLTVETKKAISKLTEQIQQDKLRQIEKVTNEMKKITTGK